MNTSDHLRFSIHWIWFFVFMILGAVVALFSGFFGLLLGLVFLLGGVTLLTTQKDETMRDMARSAMLAGALLVLLIVILALAAWVWAGEMVTFVDMSS